MGVNRHFDKVPLRPLIREGIINAQHMRGTRGPGMHSYSRATYQGPSVMETHMYVHPPGNDDRSVWLNEQRLLVTHVPIDQHSFDLRFHGAEVRRHVRHPIGLEDTPG